MNEHVLKSSNNIIKKKKKNNNNNDEVDEAINLITGLMSKPPVWADGLPVACEAKAGATYGDC